MTVFSFRGNKNPEGFLDRGPGETEFELAVNPLSVWRSDGIVCRFLIEATTSVLILRILFLECLFLLSRSYLLLCVISHTLFQYTDSSNKMPLPASFSVGPQHAQPDENTGYNTQPTFVIPGSKAAERNARRKKGSVPVLEMVPNRGWEASGSIQPQYSAPHDLMTPQNT